LEAEGAVRFERILDEGRFFAFPQGAPRRAPMRGGYVGQDGAVAP
jgi:hypothetical protein